MLQPKVWKFPAPSGEATIAADAIGATVAEIICTGPDVNVSFALGHRKLRDEDDQCTVLAVGIADGAVLAVVKERHPKVRGAPAFYCGPEQ